MKLTHVGEVGQVLKSGGPKLSTDTPSQVSLRPSRRASSTGLLQLRINRSADPVPLSNRSGTEVWHDGQGRQVGYGHAGEGWLHLPGVAMFTFGPSGVEAVAGEDVATEKIRDAHRRLVLLSRSRPWGRRCCTPARWPSRLGPSRFVPNRHRQVDGGLRTRARGHPPCADDAVAVEFGRRGPELIPPSP